MAREIDLIKEKIDLVDFLRGYLTLYPTGRNFKALCPFHQEKTPSFIVSPQRQIWHCFGCGLGGDIVGFVMRYENLEFPEALQFLAERAGLELRAINPSVQKEFGILYSIQSAAEEFFRSELMKSKEALDYLTGRGLKEETIAEFNLGYAPIGGDLLMVYLLEAGYDISEIGRAGLIYKNEKGLYHDRFEGRIIFPIKNHFGRTVAFSGRILPAMESEDKPKYLNSPETPIFAKSKILYGLDKAKTAIAAKRTVFLVEGQMDFLMSWQAGIKNCVAISGTGLTPHHLERLRRMADTMIITFDNDEAGLKALERSLDIFNNFDFHVKVVNLGFYKDPAEAAQKDPEYFLQATEWARPAFTHIFNTYFSPETKVNLDIAEKKRILRHLLLKIKNIKSAVEQNIWIKELAQISGIGETALIQEFERLAIKADTSIAVAEPGLGSPAERIDRIAARLTSIALAFNQYFDLLKQHLHFLPVAYQAVLHDPNNEKRAFLDLRFSFDFGNFDNNQIEREFNDLLRQLELEFLKKERVKLKEEMQTEETINKFYLISKRIDELSNPV
jgi:DNA primase